MGLEAQSRVTSTKVALLAACSVCACQTEPSTCETLEPVADVDSWAFVDPTDDVVWPAPADAVLCTDDDVQVQPIGDATALEIDTRFGCGWATVVQPLLVEARAGDVLRLQIFYFPQASFPEAVANVAFAVDGDVVVSLDVPIPAPAGVLAPEVVLTRDVPAGAPIAFHVGNHGDNSWNLTRADLVRTTTCE
jgi:hypothetical protein